MARGARQLTRGPREGSGGRPHRNQGLPGGRTAGRAAECIGRRMHPAAECIRRPNAFRGSMHSEAVCNEGRMQSISLLPIAYYISIKTNIRLRRSSFARSLPKCISLLKSSWSWIVQLGHSHGRQHTK